MLLSNITPDMAKKMAMENKMTLSTYLDSLDGIMEIHDGEKRLYSKNKKQNEIINGLQKLNDGGLDLVCASLRGALTSATFCKNTNQNGLIINIHFCERKHSKYSAFFRQLDKSEPGKILYLPSHRKGGIT